MREIIEKSIEEFNKHKSNEVQAYLMNFSNNLIKIKFFGELLCETYCLNDYFENMASNLDNNNVKTEIKWINTDDSCVNYLVDYEII